MKFTEIWLWYCRCLISIKSFEIFLMVALDNFSVLKFLSAARTSTKFDMPGQGNQKFSFLPMRAEIFVDEVLLN